MTIGNLTLKTTSANFFLVKNQPEKQEYIQSKNKRKIIFSQKTKGINYISF